MDEARRIAYNIASAFLADLDPHQRTIRAPCTKIKGVAFVRFRRPSLNPKSWDNYAAVKLSFQRSAYDGEGRQRDPSLKGAKWLRQSLDVGARKNLPLKSCRSDVMVLGDRASSSAGAELTCQRGLGGSACRFPRLAVDPQLRVQLSRHHGSPRPGRERRAEGLGGHGEKGCRSPLVRSRLKRRAQSGLTGKK